MNGTTDIRFEEIRRRQLAFAEAPAEKRAEAGLAYAEAQVQALRRAADKMFARHWPVARADELGSARADFRSLRRFARTVEHSIRELPREPYGPTAEDARRASEFNARLARLQRVIAAISERARELHELYDKLSNFYRRGRWETILTRRSTTASTKANCRPVRRAQGPRTRRVSLRRRTSRGSPARPDDPEPSPRRLPVDALALRGAQ